MVRPENRLCIYETLEHYVRVKSLISFFFAASHLLIYDLFPAQRVTLFVPGFYPPSIKKA
jgi:hypothetical protein